MKWGSCSASGAAPLTISNGTMSTIEPDRDSVRQVMTNFFTIGRKYSC